jgi:hypothetical protein
MPKVSDGIVAMAQLLDDKRARRRQARADTPSPVKAAMVRAQRALTFPLDQDPFA